MLTIAAPLSETGPQLVANTSPAGHHWSFHDVLSELNPLQYLPVIGTIYRAVTGDQIPEMARRIGSLVVSGLLGGPIGIVINVAVTLAEKITGVDLDQTGQTLLTGNGHADHPVNNPAPLPAPAPAAVARTQVPATPVPSPAHAWSPAQLAAYGVSTGGDGALKRADLAGADVLNALELLRIRGAQTAYGRALTLAG
jgi:hypothetical protein